MKRTNRETSSTSFRRTPSPPTVLGLDREVVFGKRQKTDLEDKDYVVSECTYKELFELKDVILEEIRFRQETYVGDFNIDIMHRYTNLVDKYDIEVECEDDIFYLYFYDQHDSNYHVKIEKRSDGIKVSWYELTATHDIFKTHGELIEYFKKRKYTEDFIKIIAKYLDTIPTYNYNN